MDSSTGMFYVSRFLTRLRFCCFWKHIGYKTFIERTCDAYDRIWMKSPWSSIQVSRPMSSFSWYINAHHLWTLFFQWLTQYILQIFSSCFYRWSTFCKNQLQFSSPLAGCLTVFLLQNPGGCKKTIIKKFKFHNSMNTHLYTRTHIYPHTKQKRYVKNWMWKLLHPKSFFICCKTCYFSKTFGAGIQNPLKSLYIIWHVPEKYM